MAKDPAQSGEELTRAELQNLEVPWPAGFLTLGTIVGAALVGGFGVTGAVLFGWAFAGASAELGHARVASATIGADATERDATGQRIRWQDARDVVVSAGRTRRRRVRITFQETAGRVVTLVLLCDAGQAAKLLTAARNAGGSPASSSGPPPWPQLGAAVLRAVLGAFVYGGVALAAGRGLHWAALAGAIFAVVASLGGVTLAFLERPLARAMAWVFPATGVVLFARASRVA